MTEPNKLRETLLTLAASRFKKDASTLGMKDDFFEKLGIDSFQAMELLTDVEDAFDVEIPDYELQDVTTFEGLAQVIEARL